jgi:hypothetical protein
VAVATKRIIWQGWANTACGRNQLKISTRESEQTFTPSNGLQKLWYPPRLKFLSIFLQIIRPKF